MLTKVTRHSDKSNENRSIVIRRYDFVFLEIMAPLRSLLLNCIFGKFGQGLVLFFLF